jgi:hypothetical protein
MDVVLEGRRGEGGALEAAVPEQITLEAERGEPRQRRQDARPVIRVGWMQFEVEQRAMLVADDEELEALDQLVTSLPPSMPRAQALGAERSERLSTTTAEGRTSSPQARRQSRAKRWPSRRHSPSRDQRAKLVGSVVKGMPESQPAMRHCIPPKVSIQISPISRRRKLRSGLRPRRCTPTRSRSMASSSASTAKPNTSTSARMFQPSPRLGRGTRQADGGSRSTGLTMPAGDIGPIWWGWAGAAHCVGSAPIYPLISRTDS